VNAHILKCLFSYTVSNYMSPVLTGLLAEITVHPLSDALCYPDIFL